MKTTEEPIVVTQTYDASPAAVWKAITVVEEMVQWFFDNIPAFEPAVGFETSFVVTNEGREFSHDWKVTEVVPQKKLSYDWRHEGYQGRALVTFELSSQGDATSLQLTMTTLEDFAEGIMEFERESGLAGWRYFIQQRLKAYLEPAS